MLLSRKLAFGGLATALVLIVISVSYISPTADLALFTLSSLFIAMVVIETDFKTGFIAYFASSILLTAFYGIYFSIPFLVIFGLFPLLKGLVENHLNRIIAYIIKGFYFCCLIIVSFFIFQDTSALILTKWNQLLSADFLSRFQSIWIIAAAAVVVLFIYDYALSLLIDFYQKRFKKIKKTN